MKFKLTLMAIACLLAFGACSSDKEETIIYGYGIYEFQGSMVDLLTFQDAWKRAGAEFGQKSFTGTKKEIEEQAKAEYNRSIKIIEEYDNESLASELVLNAKFVYGAVSSKDNKYIGQKSFSFTKP